MRLLAPALLSGVILAACSAAAVAAAAELGAAVPQGSYVPRAHATRHVYGAPISRPILGRAKTSHHPAPKKLPKTWRRDGRRTART